MAWITEEELKAELTGMLGRDTLPAPTVWDALIPRAVQAGINEVVSALVARGFTAAQAEAWDRASEFSGDMALYWALVKGSATKAYDQQAIDKLDRRAELLTVDVLIDGEEPEPDEDETGPVSVGMLENENDIFNMDVEL